MNTIPRVLRRGAQVLVPSVIGYGIYGAYTHQPHTLNPIHRDSTNHLHLYRRYFRTTTTSTNTIASTDTTLHPNTTSNISTSTHTKSNTTGSMDHSCTEDLLSSSSSPSSPSPPSPPSSPPPPFSLIEAELPLSLRVAQYLVIPLVTLASYFTSHVLNDMHIHDYHKLKRFLVADANTRVTDQAVDYGKGDRESELGAEIERMKGEGGDREKEKKAEEAKADKGDSKHRHSQKDATKGQKHMHTQRQRQRQQKHKSRQLHMLHGSRHPGQALLTVSNHAACVDDFVVLGSLIPVQNIFRPDLMRWGMCARNICFSRDVGLDDEGNQINRVNPSPIRPTWATTPPPPPPSSPSSPSSPLPSPPVSPTRQWLLQSIVAGFCGAGKALPIERGGGIEQKNVYRLTERLLNGEWVHVFPEGKLWQTVASGPVRCLPSGRCAPANRPLGPLKWGVGKIIGDTMITQRMHALGQPPSSSSRSRSPSSPSSSPSSSSSSSALRLSQHPPIVVPLFHKGMEKVQPVDENNQTIHPLPSSGHRIDVHIGDPIPFMDLIDEYFAQLEHIHAQSSISSSISSISINSSSNISSSNNHHRSSDDSQGSDGNGNGNGDSDGVGAELVSAPMEQADREAEAETKARYALYKRITDRIEDHLVELSEG